MHYPKNSRLSGLVQKAGEQLTQKRPFVLFSKPGDNTLNAIFQKTDRIHTTWDFRGTGFIMAPFQKGEPSIRIPNDERMDAPFVSGEENPPKISLKTSVGDKALKKFHLALVKKGLEQIRSGNLQKVVLSRSFEVPFQKGIVATFLALLSHYPNAFCYLWVHPKIGIWLGATPEVLLETHGKSFTTISLAGTRKYKVGEFPHWGKKEHREQHLVTQYIVQALEGRTAELRQSQLESARAGNLWHLRTKISGVLLEEGLKPLLEVLHPTPAVCGMPFTAAKDFIAREEGYDRGFYTGFLGEINPVGDARFFVNLRCAQIKGDLARIYVGGGITSGSEPEKEWLETVAKSETLLKFLIS
ncbi:MAG: chorismate-binding protein [Bacteroidota bacterium]